jgi:hypothetical protein
MEIAMNTVACTRAQTSPLRRPRRGPLFSLFTLLLLSSASWAQDKFLPIDDPPPAPDPEYTQTVLQVGDGWQLVQTDGVIEVGRVPYSERVFMIDGARGLADVPLPQVLKDELINDLAGGAEGETVSFSISQRIADEVALSEAQGAPTDALIALAEADDGGLDMFRDKSMPMAKGSCGDRDIVKSKHFNVSAPLNSNYTIGGGFSGTVALTGTANADADGEIKITLKRAKIWFLCIPYGVKFRHARVWGTVLVDQGATVSGTINYANPHAREWLIAKPHLFSIDFMAGPIPVHIGFNLPITAGFDEGGITGSVTGSVTYSGQRSLSGYLDYYCTPSECNGYSNIDTTGLGSQTITAGISGRFQPNVYAQVAIRGYLYGEGFAYAQVGVRPYLRGDLWGYYGNNCGDANGDGYFETVDALTFDLDWQLYITAQADTFLTNEWRRNLWSSPRWHIRFWDLLGGGTGSDALSPMLIGPALVPVNTQQTYGAKMRSCWPYSDAVDYTLAWGDGGTQALNGPAATVTNATHTWTTTSTPQLALTALRDAHGRQLNKTTWRPVQVTAVQGHKGMTWKLIERNGSYSHVGGDTQTDPYVGDTEPSVSLPLLCLKQDGRSAPPWFVFDFYNGWAQGEIRLTAPVQGLSLTSRAVADNLCSSTFGSGYRMGEFHDGGGGWTWWGQGVISAASRFWVAIDDQPANPWN